MIPPANRLASPGTPNIPALHHSHIPARQDVFPNDIITGKHSNSFHDSLKNILTHPPGGPANGLLVDPPGDRPHQALALPPLASRPAPPPLRRRPTGHRQGRRLCARRPLHEGHPRDAPVRLLAREHPGAGSAGRRSREVCRLQRAGGCGAEARYAYSFPRSGLGWVGLVGGMDG